MRSGQCLWRLALASSLAAVLVFVPGAGAAAGGDISAVEGQPFSGTVATGLLCPIASATITWGDNTTSAGTADGSNGIQGTHTYTEEGTYTGSVTYTYTAARPCQGATQTASLTATVQDAPLTGAGIDASGTAGQSLTAVVAHIDDTNPNGTIDDFSAQINWGDGTTSTGTVGNTTSGGFDVTGTHTYTTAGNYPITTSITDIGGSRSSAGSTAHIGGSQPPPPRPPPPPAIPDTIITNGPIGVTSDLEPRFDFLSTIPGSHFQCSLDPGFHSATWTACTTPHFTTRLAGGKHLFLVRAISPEGVADPTSAQRAFEIRPAASTEEQGCIKAEWAPPSLGGALFGGTGVLECYFPFSCPQWYDCVLSGQLTFSFGMPDAKAAYISVSHEVSGSLLVYGNEQNQNSGLCVRPGDPYAQSGETYYCSRSAQITFHGGTPKYGSPQVFCLAFTFLSIDPEMGWFTSKLLGCHGIIRRTWAPGVDHGHPRINIVRNVGRAFASPHAAVWTGLAASCPGRATCAVGVSANQAATAHVSAASLKLPQPSAALRVRTQSIGTGSLKLRPGRRARVTFSLTSSGRALLHKRHRLVLAVTITAPPARLKGRDTVIKRTITVFDRR